MKVIICMVALLSGCVCHDASRDVEYYEACMENPSCQLSALEVNAYNRAKKQLKYRCGQLQGNDK